MLNQSAFTKSNSIHAAAECPSQLSQLLSDPDADTRLTALAKLSECDFDAPERDEIKNRLPALLHDANAEIKCVALEMLDRFELSVEIVRALISILNDADLQKEVARRLQKNAEQPVVWQELVAEYQRHDPAVRRLLAKLLRFGAEEALLFLAEMRSHKDAAYAQPARDALPMIDDAALAHRLLFLLDGNRSLQLRTVAVLGCIGPQAADALHLLSQLHRTTGDPELAAAITQAIAHIDPDSPPEPCNANADKLAQQNLPRFAKSNQKAAEAPPFDLENIEIKGSLGGGQFGRTSRGFNHVDDLDVVVKELSSNLPAEVIGDVLSDARKAMGMPTHPNIAGVVAAGQADGRTWIVSQWADGVPLKDLMPTLKKNARQSAKVFAQVAEALAHCHDAGVFHHNLSPAAIRVDSAGVVRLIGFGYAGGSARLLRANCLRSEKFAYLAPEQISLARCDSEADVFAVGVMLFESFTQRSPYGGADGDRLKSQIVSTSVVLPAGLQGTELGRICLKCLHKEPTLRYVRAAQLANDLRALADADGVGSVETAIPDARAAGDEEEGWLEPEKKGAAWAYDVFVSYKHGAHAERVKKIAEALRNENNLRVWIDVSNVGAGIIGEHCRTGVEQSRMVVIAITRDMLKSTWVKREITWALERDHLASRDAVIPILLEKMSPKEVMLELNCRLQVDLHDPAQDAVNIKKLAWLILRYWMVPFVQRPISGREEFLDDLHLALIEKRIVALTGLDGIGKTTLAINYAHERRDYYHQGVFWIDATSETTLVAGLVDIGKRLDLIDLGSKDELDLAASTMRALQQRQGLIILDNANDAGVLRRYLQSKSICRVLLTSGDRHLDVEGVERIPIEPLESADALSLLLRLSNNAHATAAERRAAEELAEELERLPLALHQAAAYIEEGQIPISKFLHEFRERRDRIKLLKPPTAGADVSRPISTIWEISLEALQRNSPGGADILKLSCFLHHGFVSFDLIRKLALTSELTGERPVGNLSSRSTDLDVNNVLNGLIRYSLATRDAQQTAFHVHRLVREAQMERLTREERRTWAQRSLRVVSLAFPTPDDTNWNLCETLAPHAQEVLHWAKEFDVRSSDRWKLQANLAMYLYERRASLNDAVALFRSTLAGLERYPLHPTAIQCRAYLSCLQIAVKEPHLCEAELERTLGFLTSARQFFNALPKPTAANLSAVVKEIEEKTGIGAHDWPAGADDCAKHVAAWIEEGIQKLTALGTFADGLREMSRAAHGQNDEFESFMRDALETPGTDAERINRAVAVLQARMRGSLSSGPPGQFEPVFPSMSFGDQPGNVASEYKQAIVQMSLGMCYLHLGNGQRAEDILLKCVRAVDATVGPAHPNFALALYFVSLLRFKQNRFADAVAILKYTMETVARIFGSKCSLVTAARRHLIVNYVFQATPASLAQAQTMLDEELSELADLPFSIATEEVREVAAGLFLRMGKIAEAQDQLERACASFEKLLPTSLRLLRLYEILAFVYKKSGRWKDAKHTLEAAVAVCERMGDRGRLCRIGIDEALAELAEKQNGRVRTRRKR